MIIDLSEAVHRVREGEVIGFPTETVYGLGCDPGHEAAVRRIYELKQRPERKPLSLHVFNAAQAKPYVDHWTTLGERLAAEFWPGPVALILPRSRKLGSFVTSSEPTVGLRCPAHVPLLQMLRQLGFPLAGTSANRSGESPATDAAGVEAAFPDLPTIDGGPCKIGEASTVVDLTGEAVRILREGAVPAEEIEAFIGDDAPVQRA
jgi:L-threonylcarbamoyladenylate synthase